MEMTLEREFITEVLKKKMEKYYEIILANTVQLPPFLGGDTPKKCATRVVKELYNRDKEKFYEMYRRIYYEFEQ